MEQEIVNMPPKVIAILEGCCKLHEEGKNFGELKVADIAASAGIGKGTVYEYFSSKEEIIMKALVYEHCKQIMELQTIIEKENGFENKLDVALEWIGHDARKAFLAMQESKMDDTLNTQKMSFCHELMGEGFFERLDKMANHILSTGVKEGIIRAPKDKLERDMILTSIAVAFMSYISHAKLYKDNTYEEAKTISKQILLSYLKREN